MDFKRNIFWIVLVVVVLAGIGGYAAMISGVKADGKDLSALKDEAQKKAEVIKTLATRADDKTVPDPIKNAEHVKLAADYKARLDSQIKAMQEAWKTRKLDVRFTDAPAGSDTKFDSWLGELRNKLTDQAAKANLALPADADKMMFKEPTTDEQSPDVTRHRDYRLRQMAIVEEVITVLCRKYGKQQTLKFEPNKDLQEPQETVETGVLALDRITVTPTKALLGATKGGDKGLSSEDRIKTWMEDAVRRSGRVQRESKPSNAVELPYSITSVDIQFVAPLANVPGVARAIETSARFGAAVVTRIDYQRAVSPFPAPGDPKPATAGPVPMQNTHYQEGPVRALVSLDIYEYDTAKEAAAKAKAEEKPAEKPGDKKKK